MRCSKQDGPVRACKANINRLSGKPPPSPWLLYTDAFTHQNFCTDALTHQLIHTQTLLHQRFDTQTLLHTQAATQAWNNVSTRLVWWYPIVASFCFLIEYLGVWGGLYCEKFFFQIVFHFFAFFPTFFTFPRFLKFFFFIFLKCFSWFHFFSDPIVYCSK